MFEMMHGVEDRGYVSNFKLHRLETLVSGGLGLQMEMAQQQAQAGLLIPKGVAATAQRELDLTKGTRLTAAAQQRSKAEHKWLTKRQTAQIKALQLQEKTMLAAKSRAFSTSSTGEDPELPEQAGEAIAAQPSTAQPSAVG